MVGGIDYENVAVFGFACVIAWRLLTFFLTQLTKKLDCIKDTLIEVLDVLKELRQKETQRGG